MFFSLRRSVVQVGVTRIVWLPVGVSPRPRRHARGAATESFEAFGLILEVRHE